MKFKGLRQYIDSGNTLLGVGSMSQNIVDATIELADEKNIPILLIASRRQIDSYKIKRGYVNNWSTEDFVQYIKTKTKSKNIIIARDHGGPWQNNIEIEKRLSLKDAMKSAKDSYAIDIDSGFDFIHIDPSIDIFQQLSNQKILERLSELYQFCTTYSNSRNKNIEFEVGTEEQMIYLNSKEELKKSLKGIKELCTKNNYKQPFFVVTQIGTKVIEMKNIGILNQDKNIQINNEIKELIDIVISENFYIKVHNTDYLKTNILRNFPKLRISAANVAPEFGVYETKCLLKLLEQYSLYSLKNEFLEIAYNSNRWRKWLLDSSMMNKMDKAIIAGHYIFATAEFKKLKEIAQKKIKEINIDIYLKDEIKKNILVYLDNFSVLTNKKGIKCIN